MSNACSVERGKKVVDDKPFAGDSAVMKEEASAESTQSKSVTVDEQGSKR